MVRATLIHLYRQNVWSSHQVLNLVSSTNLIGPCFMPIIYASLPGALFHHPLSHSIGTPPLTLIGQSHIQTSSYQDNLKTSDKNLKEKQVEKNDTYTGTIATTSDNPSWWTEAEVCNSTVETRKLRAPTLVHFYNDNGCVLFQLCLRKVFHRFYLH